MTCGIYGITNLTNGHRYVGQSVNIEQRWRDHRSAMNRGIHHSDHLQNAWNKYGSDCFVFEILETISNDSHLTEREQVWMDSESSYNVCPAAGSPAGFKRPPRSTEHRANLSAALMGHAPTRTGPNSPEHNAKIGLAHLGKPNPGQRGFPKSPETRAKIGAANRGRSNPAVSESNRRRRKCPS